MYVAMKCWEKNTILLYALFLSISLSTAPCCPNHSQAISRVFSFLFLHANTQQIFILITY